MARPRTVLTALLLSAVPAAASPTPPDAEAPKALLQLRNELWEAGRARAAASPAKFRPLCDKDGYPLVGNVANKGEVYQPSQFCSDVRAAEKTKAWKR